MPVSAPVNAREYVFRLRPASLQPRYPGAGVPAPGAAIYTGQKMLRPKSFFFRCGRPPRPTARPPGEPHWWRGRPSQQFARKDTFRAPRTGVLDRFGPLERELARPRTRAPTTRALRADMCLNRRSSQVNTRARYSCANQKNAQQPLYLQSWPRKVRLRVEKPGFAVCALECEDGIADERRGARASTTTTHPSVPTQSSRCSCKNLSSAKRRRSAPPASKKIRT